MRNLALAAAALALSAAAPVARADALAEVRIVQVQLGPDGGFTELGAPLVVRSFSDGVASTDFEFFHVPVSVQPGQSQSWDFSYTVSMRADGHPFAGDSPLPPACVPLLAGPCAPPLDGQSLAWSFLTIGHVDPRTMLPWAQLSGADSLTFTLREGSFGASGLVHLEAGTSSEFSGWSGALTVGAVTLAAAVPEPATYAQFGVGLALLAGAVVRRRRLQGRALSPSVAAACR